MPKPVLKSVVDALQTSENVGHAEDALIPVQPSPHLPTPSTPSRPLLEIGEPAGKTYEGSPADLVGPSFSTRPSGGSSVPSVAPSLLDPPERGTRRRPLYGGGTALLWPLSAPAPPPSLTSAPGVGPAITRDRVQLALQKLVQVRVSSSSPSSPVLSSPSVGPAGWTWFPFSGAERSVHRPAVPGDAGCGAVSLTGSPGAGRPACLPPYVCIIGGGRFSWNI